jgi:hypothetical protein
MLDTTRSQLEDLIREAPPEIRQDTNRLAPEGTSLAERPFTFLIARDRAALDEFRSLARTAPRGSDDRKWPAEIRSDGMTIRIDRREAEAFITGRGIAADP